MKNGIFKERMLLRSKFSNSNFHQIHIIESKLPTGIQSAWKSAQITPNIGCISKT
ncbi:hypothetical protein GBA52_007957 [Prunus armeniaca]|nr:hypothetical protein GBA52_007957 [Prunus armeniaca]